MKRRNPHAAAIGAEERFDARAHFFRRLVGERDGEHFGRLGVAIAHEVRDTARDDARLTGARAREDEERPRDLEDRFALLRVQCVEKLHFGGVWRTDETERTEETVL